MSRQRHPIASSRTWWIKSNYPEPEAIMAFMRDHPENMKELYRSGLKGRDGIVEVMGHLYQESHNTYDSNAIIIVVSGKEIGYIASEVAAVYAPKLRRIRRSDIAVAVPVAVADEEEAWVKLPNLKDLTPAAQSAWEAKAAKQGQQKPRRPQRVERTPPSRKWVEEKAQRERQRREKKARAESETTSAPEPAVKNRTPTPQVRNPFEKSFAATILLSLFLGTLGADRFYLGHHWLGIAKLLLSWMTFGVWQLIDLVLIITKSTPALRSIRWT